MEFIYLFVAFLSGFFTMAVADKNGWNKVFGFLAGPMIVGLLIFVFLGFPEDKKQSDTDQTLTSDNVDTKNGAEVDSEYGSTLTECLQKADAWLADAKQTAKSVLAEEKTKNNRYQGYIDQNALSENEIMASLETEWRDYQTECRSHFR
ncbi:MAG: hypothetical protein AAB446_02095 [Patescibacteria group bacterium]